MIRITLVTGQTYNVPVGKFNLAQAKKAGWFWVNDQLAVAFHAIASWEELK